MSADPHPATIVHVGIARPWQAVYAYVSDPANMPAWASGLAQGLRPTDDALVFVGDGGPLGEITIRFTAPNELGVVDHTVTLPTGTSVHNALRVVPNGDGSEVMFTVLQMPGTDDDAFAADVMHVQSDLETLVSILEADGAR